MARPEGRGRGLAPLLVLGVVAAVLALAVVISGRPPEGPVAVDWDGTRCARCGMLVSDPDFAAQLHLTDGSVRHFDDPGCLLLALDEVEEGERHAVWLHHHARDGWVPLDEAAFVPVPHSPMGYGLGVVAAGEAPRSMSVQAARSRLAEQPSEGPAHAPGREHPPGREHAP